MFTVEISVVVESVKQTESGVQTGRLGVRTALAGSFSFFWVSGQGDWMSEQMRQEVPVFLGVRTSH
jgi:hypothetical protein